MIIKVAKEDFELAIIADPCHCPLANAIHRHTKRAVHVSDMIAWIRGLGSYSLPPKARQFIQRFDNGEAVRGGTFELTKIKGRSAKP